MWIRIVNAPKHAWYTGYVGVNLNVKDCFDYYLYQDSKFINKLDAVPVGESRDTEQHLANKSED